MTWFHTALTRDILVTRPCDDGVSGRDLPHSAEALRASVLVLLVQCVPQSISQRSKMRNLTRTMALALISALFALVTPEQAQAQNAVITGKVTSQFGQAVEGANVYINDL